MKAAFEAPAKPDVTLTLSYDEAEQLQFLIGKLNLSKVREIVNVDGDDKFDELYGDGEGWTYRLHHALYKLLEVTS